MVRWDQLCAAILWRNGRVGFSFLVYTISKNALASIQTIQCSGQSHNTLSDGFFINRRKAELDRFALAGPVTIAAQWHHIDLPPRGRVADVLSKNASLSHPMV